MNKQDMIPGNPGVKETFNSRNGLLGWWGTYCGRDKWTAFTRKALGVAIAELRALNAGKNSQIKSLQAQIRELESKPRVPGPGEFLWMDRPDQKAFLEIQWKLNKAKAENEMLVKTHQEDIAQINTLCEKNKDLEDTCQEMLNKQSELISDTNRELDRLHAKLVTRDRMEMELRGQLRNVEEQHTKSHNQAVEYRNELKKAEENCNAWVDKCVALKHNCNALTEKNGKLVSDLDTVAECNASLRKKLEGAVSLGYAWMGRAGSLKQQRDIATRKRNRVLGGMMSDYPLVFTEGPELKDFSEFEPKNEVKLCGEGEYGKGWYYVSTPSGDLSDICKDFVKTEKKEQAGWGWTWAPVVVGIDPACKEDECVMGVCYGRD